MTLQNVKIVGKQLKTVLLSFVLFMVFFHRTSGYLDVNQYCRAFDENFKPIICLLKNGTRPSHPHPPPNYNPPHHPQHPPPPPPTQYPILYPTQRPPPPDYIDYDEDDDCSCEITCIPRIINQRSFLSNDLNEKKRYKRTPSTSYRCKSCGTECSVSTSRPATCNCAIPASKSECTCIATCATFRYANPYYFQNNEDDDAQCILSVTALEDWRLGEERPPYLCECQRSKEAENSSRPDFICICQRITRND